MRNLKNPTGQVARWLEELGTYNLTVTHPAGLTHINADALSRSPCSKCAKQHSGNIEPDCSVVTQTETASISDDVLPDSHIPTRVVQQSPDSNTVLFKSTMANMPDWSIDSIKADQLYDPDLKFIIQLLQQSEDQPQWQAVRDK
ncbi:hypothetical protein DPMN_080412 [Dreissena polymorpha]|uniref:Uncharacterized protein n=1 Tax=Dreissena polymorpha TaxID=45954 RepID=A0A9D3YWB8_DREPO|nr:hypothetical protein DPMN_080412 [Dreissena polymorpha]